MAKKKDGRELVAKKAAKWGLRFTQLQTMLMYEMSGRKHGVEIAPEHKAEYEQFVNDIKDQLGI